MSAPSHGFLIKDGTFVGAGMCNMGWVFSVSGLAECIKDVLSCVKDVAPDPSACCIPWYPWYYGDIAAAAAFDSIVVYGCKFDRELALSVATEQMTAQQFELHIQNNGGLEAFAFSKEQMNIVYVNTETVRGPRPS